jgi:hypothetical protein
MTTFKHYLQTLNEAPLPDDWDVDIYSERVPFSKRIAYAKQMATRLGAGSSRVAFEIPYQGRRSVLKIAKNSKGMAQNEEETSLLNDWYLKNLGIIIPMIDYDEANNVPTWIHTEFANKATVADFRKATGGGELKDLLAYAGKFFNKKVNGGLGGDASKIDPESEFVQAVVDMIGNYDQINDLGSMSNWGIYNGHPVIVDVGGTSDVLNKHYGANIR